MCREGDDLHWNDSDRRDEVKGQCSYWRTKRVGDLEGEITSIDKQIESILREQGTL